MKVDTGSTSPGIDLPPKPVASLTSVTTAINSDNSTSNKSIERKNNSDVIYTKSEQAQKATNAQSEIEQNSFKISESIEVVVGRINQYMKSIARELEFNIDQDSGDTIVKVIDKSTDEVIRQLPAEKFFEIAKDLDNAAGNFLNAQV